MFKGHLSHQQLLDLQGTAIQLGLTSSRSALMAGLPAGFVAGLQQTAAPGPQLMMDLSALNTIERLIDDSIPLEIWLRNALLLTSYAPQSSIFQEALDAIGAEEQASGTQSATTPPPQAMGLPPTPPNPPRSPPTPPPIPPEEEPEFDVLLCHNTEDKPAIRTLAGLLDDQGLSVWFDEWELIPGTPRQEATEKALGECGSVAVFLGPSGIGPWQNEEMRAALADQVNGRPGFRVIPVQLPSTKEPSLQALPLFLKRRQWVHFNSLQDQRTLEVLIRGIRGLPPGRPR